MLSVVVVLTTLRERTKAFSVVDISQTISGNGKYHAGVLAPTGDIIFVPRNAKGVGVFSTSNLELRPLPIVPQSWHALLSPYFNNF